MSGCFSVGYAGQHSSIAPAVLTSPTRCAALGAAIRVRRGVKQREEIPDFSARQENRQPFHCAARYDQRALRPD